jgi:hypothetical protein
VREHKTRCANISIGTPFDKYGQRLFMNTSLKIKSCFVILALVGFVSAGHAQNMDKEKVKTVVQSKHFVFKAQSVMPQGMASRQLTSEYDVRISNDSVITYLPYYGRSYSAPAPGEEGGFKFTSTNFDYKAKATKKGGWDIHIRPHDAKDVRDLFLSITTSGYASLQVTSDNRQAISFYGYIEEK